MSTAPVTPAPTPSPKVQNILNIINIALQGLTVAGSFTPISGAINAAVNLEQLFQGMLTNALAAYQAEVGQPINLALIPLESPVS